MSMELFFDMEHVVEVQFGVRLWKSLLHDDEVGFHQMSDPFQDEVALEDLVVAACAVRWQCV